MLQGLQTHVFIVGTEMEHFNCANTTLCHDLHDLREFVPHAVYSDDIEVQLRLGRALPFLAVNTLDK